LAAAFLARGPLVRQSTSVSVLPVELPYAQASFALRMTRRLTLLEANPAAPRTQMEREIQAIEGGPQKSSIVYDVLGFASGRVEIALIDLHEPGVTPLRTERRLLSLLYSRARVHRL
jgi:hypothetical protein